MLPPTLPQTWPNRARSRHIACAPHLWHVQDIGTGPTILLIHGAGASTHSFRTLIPHLHGYRIIAIDTPGQGFTVLRDRQRCGLDPTAHDIAALIAQQNWDPAAIIGHSAGAALALRLAELRPTRAVIGINAALAGFDGLQAWLFPAAARVMSLLPLVPTLFSKFAASPAKVRSLIASTGSQIDAAGEAQYLHLLQMPGHIASTLAMMAQWQLDGLLSRLPQQQQPCLLIATANDRAVPPIISRRAADRMPGAQLAELPDYGHLVHEEAPEPTATLIRDFLTRHGIPPESP